MADLMIFPKTIQEFIKDYSFKDEQEVYTNGAMLIPVFRMEQAYIFYGQQIREQTIKEITEQLKYEFGSDDIHEAIDETVKQINKNVKLN